MSAGIHIPDCVEAVQRLHGRLLSNYEQPIRTRLEGQSQRILGGLRDGNTAGLFHLSNWCRRFVGWQHDAIIEAGPSITDAREAMAREYGYEEWAAVEGLGDRTADAAFESAVDRLLAGDLSGLRAALEREPQLVAQRSAYGHEAMLLHYVGSNGVETHRQVVPQNLAAIARLLLEFGADVDAIANIYGGSTTLALLTSSAHPKQAGVVDEVASVLREFGAAG